MARRDWLFGGGGDSFFSSRGEEKFSILQEWKFNLPLPYFTSSQLRFYFSSIFNLRFLVAADFGVGTVSRFWKYFLEIHYPCQKWLQRDVTTFPWITSPDWLLRILNNFPFSEKFSFSEVVWLPYYLVVRILLRHLPENPKPSLGSNLVSQVRRSKILKLAFSTWEKGSDSGGKSVLRMSLYSLDWERLRTIRDTGGDKRSTGRTNC